MGTCGYYQQDRAGFWLGLVRIVLGMMLLWAFADKLLGLGMPTPAGMGYLDGGSPTDLYLEECSGWFAPLFNAMASVYQVTDVLMLVGLLLVGATLLLGVASKLSAIGGVLMMALFFLASVPPADNPFLDYHLVYIFALLAVYYGRGFARLGLEDRWQKLSPVVRFPLLA